MILLCNTLLTNDRVRAIPADIGKIFKPIILIDSTDSKIVFTVL